MLGFMEAILELLHPHGTKSTTPPEASRMIAQPEDPELQ
jgi:hypothetical protein